MYCSFCDCHLGYFYINCLSVVIAVSIKKKQKKQGKIEYF